MSFGARTSSGFCGSSMHGTLTYSISQRLRISSMIVSAMFFGVS